MNKPKPFVALMLRLFPIYFLYLAYLICSLCCLPSTLNAATLHSILVANTIDWEIGQAARSDFNRFKQESYRISEATGLNLIFYEFRGTNYRAESIVECIQTLEVSPEDVVLYFHSSHGLRTHSMAFDPCPLLDFGSRQSLYLRDVIKMIEEKRPRLSVILADCCNPWIPNILPPSIFQVHAKVDGASIRQTQYEQYQRLFLIPRGHIILLGSEAGGHAYANSLYGSYCTFHWTQILDRFTKFNQPLTWKDLLQHTQEIIKDATHFPIDNAPKPQMIWYSIQLDNEEPFKCPTFSHHLQENAP